MQVNNYHSGRRNVPNPYSPWQLIINIPTKRYAEFESVIVVIAIVVIVVIVIVVIVIVVIVVMIKKYDSKEIHTVTLPLHQWFLALLEVLSPTSSIHAFIEPFVVGVFFISFKFKTCVYNYVLY